MVFTHKFVWRSTAVALACSSTLLALTLLVVFHRFYPTDRAEAKSPGAGRFRAFTMNEGFGDISIRLYVCDWPHTFFAPLRVGGDLYWPGRYSATANWSSDGSVVAIRTMPDTSQEYHFTAAYDFLRHRPLDSGYQSDGSGDLNQQIADLIGRRGGLADALPEDEGKGGEHPYTPLPFWAWIPVGMVAYLGLRGAVRVWRIAGHARN